MLVNGDAPVAHQIETHVEGTEFYAKLSINDYPVGTYGPATSEEGAVWLAKQRVWDLQQRQAIRPSAVALQRAQEEWAGDEEALRGGPVTVLVHTTQPLNATVCLHSTVVMLKGKRFALRVQCHPDDVARLEAGLAVLGGVA